MFSIPVPWWKLSIFRCKKLMTLKHAIISNEFVTRCYKIMHILSVPFYPPIIIIHSYKSFIQHINSRPPLLPTCLICLHYRNLTSVFSKVIHSLVFLFSQVHAVLKSFILQKGPSWYYKALYKLLHATDREKSQGHLWWRNYGIHLQLVARWIDVVQIALWRLSSFQKIFVFLFYSKVSYKMLA